MTSDILISPRALEILRLITPEWLTLDSRNMQEIPEMKELSSWSEYKGDMDSVDFSSACFVSAAIWPVAILVENFAYLCYRNDTP